MRLSPDLRRSMDHAHQSPYRHRRKYTARPRRAESQPNPPYGQYPYQRSILFDLPGRIRHPARPTPFLLSRLAVGVFSLPSPPPSHKRHAQFSPPVCPSHPRRPIARSRSPAHVHRSPSRWPLRRRGPRCRPFPRQPSNRDSRSIPPRPAGSGYSISLNLANRAIAPLPQALPTSVVRLSRDATTLASSAALIERWTINGTLLNPLATATPESRGNLWFTHSGSRLLTACAVSYLSSDLSPNHRINRGIIAHPDITEGPGFFWRQIDMARAYSNDPRKVLIRRRSAEYRAGEAADHV